MVFNEGGMVFIVLLMCLVWVCVYVDECNFDQVQLGCKVLFYIDGCLDKLYYGQIGFVLLIVEFILKIVEMLDLCIDFVYCLCIVVIDVDDVLCQGMLVMV